VQVCGLLPSFARVSQYALTVVSLTRAWTWLPKVEARTTSNATSCTAHTWMLPTILPCGALDYTFLCIAPPFVSYAKTLFAEYLNSVLMLPFAAA
jgi:hypothetical protein